MWLGRDPAIIRDPACIAYLIYTAPASKQDPALIWTRLINGHIRYIHRYSVTISRLLENATALSKRRRVLHDCSVLLKFTEPVKLAHCAFIIIQKHFKN